MTHKDLNLIPSMYIKMPGIVPCTCNLSTGEVDMGGYLGSVACYNNGTGELQGQRENLLQNTTWLGVWGQHLRSMSSYCAYAHLHAASSSLHKIEDSVRRASVSHKVKKPKACASPENYKTRICVWERKLGELQTSKWEKYWAFVLWMSTSVFCFHRSMNFLGTRTLSISSTALSM